MAAGCWLLVIFLLVFVVVGCRANAGQDAPFDTAVPPTLVLTPTAIANTAVSVAPTLTAEPTALPTSTAVMQPATAGDSYQDLALNPERLYLYPVPALYVGDMVTIQIGAHVPPTVNPHEVAVQVWIDGELRGQNRLTGRNFAGDATAVFPWAWSTNPLQAGSYDIEIRLDPDDLIQIGDENPANNIFTHTVTLLPAGQRSAAENQWQWTTVETEYAYIHVVEGTAAHRDLNDLVQATDDAVIFAATRLGLVPQRKYDVFFINRVIGQGGYAGNVLVVSYPDRPYAGSGFGEVLVHEIIHLLDLQIAPRRLPFLAEGVAVWATGGHYKQENLHTRMAAVQELGLFIPLTEIADDFYLHQHEISYLQMAALLQYLVDQHGWPAVRDFYTSVEAVAGQTNTAVFASQIESHFGLTLPQLEDEWRTFLRNQPYDPNAIPDLQTTIRYYNIMRRYQQAHDPTAYFMTAWLPMPTEMRQRQITADLTRKPREEINVVLETMLVAADSALRTQDYQRANVLINSVERVLETGSIIDPLAASYREIVQKADRAGYEVKRIEMNGNEAVVFATQAGRPQLIELSFSRTTNAWILLR